MIDFSGLAVLVAAITAAIISLGTFWRQIRAENRAIAREAVLAAALEAKATEAERKAKVIQDEVVADREQRDLKLKEMSDNLDGKLTQFIKAREDVARHEGEAAGQAAERAAPMVPAPTPQATTPGVPAGTADDPLHAVLDQPPHQPVPVMPIKKPSTDEGKA